MLLTDFNAMTAAAAADVLRPCADVTSWLDAVVRGRPYGTLGELVAAADLAARSWSPEEVDAALAQHPRIGERATGERPEAALSRAEQSAIRGRDDAVSSAIADGNAAYERRFGRVFLVRAAGRTAPEILQQLQRRLDHDTRTEDHVVSGELREIALLRIEGMFTS